MYNIYKIDNRTLKKIATFESKDDAVSEAWRLAKEYSNKYGDGYISQRYDYGKDSSIVQIRARWYQHYYTDFEVRDHLITPCWI